MAEVAERVGISYAALKRRVSRGSFPAPDQKFGRTPLWLASTVDAWKETRQKGS